MKFGVRVRQRSRPSQNCLTDLHCNVKTDTTLARASCEAGLSPGELRSAMMLKATDIRRGMVITIDGVNFVVQDFAHHTPGNLRAMVQTKLRNMNTGT